MTTRGALAVIAAIVLGLGVVLAFVSVSASGDIACGSALTGADTSRTSEAALADVTGAFGKSIRDGSAYSNTGTHVAQCQDRVTTQRLVAFPLVALGAVTLLFLGITAAAPKSRVQSDL